MNALFSGFLVVFSRDGIEREGSFGYEGVDRVPPYPGKTEEETAALDRYVFDCKDPQTNLIPSIEAAEDILDDLSQSERSYEIILCCEGPSSEAVCALNADCVDHLGFDVAAIQSDYWSIVDDFSNASWAQGFRSRLNEHGLFADERDAEQYLREYKHRNEVDSDSPLEVVYVVRVHTERRAGPAGLG